MIITEPTPVKPKEQEQEPQAQPSTPPMAPPPSYTAPYPQQVHTQTYPVYAEQIVVYRQSPARRFFKAFAVAALIWFLFAMLTQSIVELGHGGAIGGDWNPFPGENCPGNTDWEERGSHPEWAPTYPYYSGLTLELPVDADILSLVTRGPNLSGVVKIVTSDDIDPSYMVMDISVAYFDEGVLRRTTACSINRSARGNHAGVGIFTPSWWFPRRMEDHLQFRITILLPATANEPLHIKNLDLRTPLFAYQIDQLLNKVTFDDVVIKTSNTPIDVKSINTVTGNFETSNAPILGTFNTSNTLVLTTSNAPVMVDVNLFNERDRHATELVASTSNAPVEAAVSLLSSSRSGGSYIVQTRTSNNAMNVNFPTSPLNSYLELNARSSNGPIKVSAHPAFEGEFNLETSNAIPYINVDDRVGDPAGRGRHRSVSVSRVGKRAMGEVYWESDAQRSGGYIIVKTSNSPVFLNL